MTKIVFSITVGVFFAALSCGEKMPDQPIHKAPVLQEAKVVKPEPSVTYTGNFVALLDSICKTGNRAVSVTHRPYEVIITRDSLGHKSIQSYSSQFGKGKKRSLSLERICLPTDTSQFVDCLSYFKKNRLFEKWPLTCNAEFAALEGAFFSYGREEYFFLQSVISENCIGSGCRVHDYAVFYVNETFCDLFVLEHEDDIAKFRILDFNQDRHLDFLEVTHDLEDNEDKLLDAGKKEGANNYKIRVVSFLNGKWQYLKDASGKTYYIVIQLKRGLDPDSPYKIYASNWPVPLK
jgi:hypothetical protein